MHIRVVMQIMTKGADYEPRWPQLKTEDESIHLGTHGADLVRTRRMWLAGRGIAIEHFAIGGFGRYTSARDERPGNHRHRRRQLHAPRRGTAASGPT